MSRGFLGVMAADLHLPTAGSLKDKRKPLAHLKAALVKATGCSVSEVAAHDLIRRARIGLATVTVSEAEARRLGDVAERILFSGPFEVLSVRRHVLSVDEVLPDNLDVI